MDKSLINKFQELIKYIENKKTETEIAFQSITSEAKRIEKFKIIFSSIRGYTDSLID